MGEMIKYYQLKRGCCHELNITLCMPHLVERVSGGWSIKQDRGVDGLPCFDCREQVEAETKVSPPQAGISNDPQG